jgi:hypothetical protein
MTTEEQRTKYANALEVLRRILRQHAVNGPDAYFDVVELFPVLDAAEAAIDKPIPESDADCALQACRRTLQRLVVAVRSGEESQVQDALQVYTMLYESTPAQATELLRARWKKIREDRDRG